MKKFKPLYWDLSLVGAISVAVATIVIWIFSTLSTSAEVADREKRVLQYVDDKYSNLNQKVDKQAEVLQRIDDRVYRILTRPR